MAPLLDLSGTLIHRYELLGPVALHEPHELAVGLRLKDWQDEVKRLSDIDTIGVIIAFAVGAMPNELTATIISESEYRIGPPESPEHVPPQSLPGLLVVMRLTPPVNALPRLISLDVA